MSECVMPSNDATASAHRVLGASSGQSLEHWIERCHALDEDALQLLAPMLDTLDALDTLRMTIALSPALANPGQALAARYSRPLDDFMSFAFQLHQLATFLQEPQHSRRKSMAALDAWCRRRLEIAATEHQDIALDLTEWCFEMIARFDPAFGAWLRSVVQDPQKRREQHDSNDSQP